MKRIARLYPVIYTECASLFRNCTVIKRRVVELKLTQNCEEKAQDDDIHKFLLSKNLIVPF